MPLAYEIIFHSPVKPYCRIESFSGSRGNYYELEDGSHIDVHTVPVWCRQCGKVTHGEEIETQEAIDARLAHLVERRAAMLLESASEKYPAVQDLGPPFSIEHLEKWRRRSEWRRSRTSPPRCIRCGSTEIVALPPGKRLPHPAGPGWIVVEVIGLSSTWFNEWFFSPEGERIPRDTKPTYWGLPSDQ